MAVLIILMLSRPQAQLMLPEKRLIHPNFLFEHAWNYQELLTTLQDDVNLAAHEVQTAVSGVLKTSTAKTLQQYQDHVYAVQDEYVPMLEVFRTLLDTDCRREAETILNSTTTFTGFRASNCAQTYDSRVRNEISVANDMLSRFDDLYSQVQLIVYKAFMGHNTFVNPETIEDTITEIYNIVNDRWELSRPEMEALIMNLSSAIAAQNNELGICHNANLEYAKSFYSMFRSMVQTCLDFDNTPDPFALSSKKGRSVEPFRALSDEFHAQMAIAESESFEWKA